MASTQIDVPFQSSLLNQRTSQGSSSRPPEYDSGDYVELRVLSTTSSASGTSLPQYETAIQSTTGISSSPSSQLSFHATKAFQIETLGHPLIALPLPPRPTPIPIYDVDMPSGAITSLAYESIRPARCSGNSTLIRASADAGAPTACLTTYRFGPNRPPKIQLAGSDEEFEVHSKGIATRAQVMRTPLGTFQWRYAGRRERREAAGGADSLLVMERVTSVALAGGKREERRREVARLVRNAEFRTEGSRICTAGNGGRLMVDLREWLGTKGEAEQMEAPVVASCLVMLKKEVDRRRVHQAVVIMAAASSGP